MGGLSVLVLAVAAGLWALRRGLTPPRLTDAPNLAPGDPHPQAVNLPTVGDGRQLHALWLPPQTGSPGNAAAPAAVLLHGWGGNGATLWPAARALHAAGFAVLLPDARSHGLSDADTFSSLPRFAQDLDAALAWVRQQPGVDAGRLCALGHSVGGAAALLSASRRRDLAAVVSVSAFAHPENVMRRWLEARHIPYWPVGWAVNRYVEHVIGHRFNAIAPIATLPRIACPVLLVHGLQDNVVPPDCAHRLRAVARPGGATLWAVTGTHERFDNETDLMRQVTLWLASVPAAPQAPPFSRPRPV